MLNPKKNTTKTRIIKKEWETIMVNHSTIMFNIDALFMASRI